MQQRKNQQGPVHGHTPSPELGSKLQSVCTRLKREGIHKVNVTTLRKLYPEETKQRALVTRASSLPTTTLVKEIVAVLDAASKH